MREELQEEADHIISKTLISNAQSLEGIRNDPELAILEAKDEAMMEDIENPDQYEELELDGQDESLAADDDQYMKETGNSDDELDGKSGEEPPSFSSCTRG